MSDSDASSLSSSVRTYRHRLDHLAVEGRQIAEALVRTSDSPHALGALSVWQRECAATIGQLSGGTKAHWLARAYSEALLVPLPPTESARATTIVERILAVLARADASLTQVETIEGSGPSSAATVSDQPRQRFGFVKDETLRANLESAYRDGCDALAGGDAAHALVTFCSVLEAAITDALGRRGLEQLVVYDPPPGPVAGWPFETRLALAQRAGIISGGCSRLPATARDYHRLLDSQGAIRPDVSVSPDEAMLTRQVLHVILRDLAPGR